MKTVLNIRMIPVVALILSSAVQALAGGILPDADPKYRYGSADSYRADYAGVDGRTPDPAPSSVPSKPPKLYNVQDVNNAIYRLDFNKDEIAKYMREIEELQKRQKTLKVDGKAFKAIEVKISQLTVGINTRSDQLKVATDEAMKLSKEHILDQRVGFAGEKFRGWFSQNKNFLDTLLKSKIIKATTFAAAFTTVSQLANAAEGPSHTDLSSIDATADKEINAEQKSNVGATRSGFSSFGSRNQQTSNGGAK